MEKSSVSLSCKYNRKHKELLRTIRSVLLEGEYQKTTYIDLKNEKRTMYIVSELGCELLEKHHIEQKRQKKIN